MQIKRRKFSDTSGDLNAPLCKDHISCIIEAKDFDFGGLFLGDIFAASRLSTLKVDMIRAVLTVSNETNLKYPKEIKHMIIEAEDRPDYDLKKHF